MCGTVTGVGRSSSDATLESQWRQQNKARSWLGRILTTCVEGLRNRSRPESGARSSRDDLSEDQLNCELEEVETPARYRPDSLGALCKLTRFSQEELKRIYRGFKAECPTGLVREEAFKTIYSQFFPQGANSSQYAHYVFNTLDQERSGVLSFEDFVVGLSVLCRGTVEEKLRWTFDLYDLNGDGRISREELAEMVCAVYSLVGRGPEPSDQPALHARVDHIFQKMDRNGDGVVTIEEFLESCMEDEGVAASMSVLDTFM